MKRTKKELKLIDELVQAFEAQAADLERFRKQLLIAVESSEILELSHSIRTRIKQPDRLRKKLELKMDKCKSDRVTFEIDTSNLFNKINDLVGCRILHLYTRQFPKINDALLKSLADYRIDITEGPIARTWDLEYTEFFKEHGVEILDSPSLYTSVHYVVNSNSVSEFTAEIQVRTLMEEVWGEVDHKLNYPTPTNVLAVSEQLKVLARVTSSATRLVDSIFNTFEDQRFE